MKNMFKKALPLLLLLSLLLSMFCTFVTADDTIETEDPVREGDYTSPRSGNALVAVEGVFVTVGEAEKQKILGCINAFRLEACNEGVKNPATGKKLTPQDYTPMVWSGMIEMIAALRAVEASVTIDHKRLAVDSSVFNVNYNVWTNAECLAWNCDAATVDGIINGLYQFYEEKSIWVNGGSGVTGHYTSMINPTYVSFGISGFHNPFACFPLSVAAQFSSNAGDEAAQKTAGIGGPVRQKTEVNTDLIDSLSLSGQGRVRVGESAQYAAYATIEGQSYYGGSGYGQVFAGLSWSSSAPGVAEIDGNGVLVAHAKGTTTITAVLTDGRKAEARVEVCPANEPAPLSPAAGAFAYSVSTQGVTIDKYNGTGPDGKIVIPAQIDGKPVVAIGERAFEDCEALKEIVLPGTLKRIGQKAFSGCMHLKAVVIPEGVVEIGDEAFSSCSQLRAAVLPASLTRLGSDFNLYSGLTDIYYRGTDAQWDKVNCRYYDLLTVTVHTGWGAGSTLYGDVNRDGTVNKKDSLLLKKYLADNTEEIDSEASDVYKDGIVNKKDSLRLKQYLAGWNVALGT